MVRMLQGQLVQVQMMKGPTLCRLGCQLMAVKCLADWGGGSTAAVASVDFAVVNGASICNLFGGCLSSIS